MDANLIVDFTLEITELPQKYKNSKKKTENENIKRKYSSKIRTSKLFGVRIFSQLFQNKIRKLEETRKRSETQTYLIKRIKIT